MAPPRGLRCDFGLDRPAQLDNLQHRFQRGARGRAVLAQQQRLALQFGQRDFAAPREGMGDMGEQDDGVARVLARQQLRAVTVMQDGRLTASKPDEIARKSELSALEATEKLMNTCRPIRESIEEL